jgi:non-specific serine/threonine protein kinase
MSECGFGALLADDMGLGKTVQIIALLEYWRAQTQDAKKTLLVVPASLVPNWQKEVKRFAPKLRVQVLYGKEKKPTLENADLFITTYGMSQRIPELPQITWDLLCVDEAQGLKNHGAKQTKAVNSIPAKSKVAMTGTPIENRLGDLWSLFDFLDKGLLGSQAEFKDLAASLEKNAEGYERLRSAVKPFLLRRLKTDKTVISDLPDKIEVNQYINLTKKQIGHYQSYVEQVQSVFDDENTTGIQRSGQVIAALTKFKQICNHPSQFVGDGIFAPEDSGKFDALAEICETIREKRERVLVFTQFKEMCEPLSAFLKNFFGMPGLVLHGSTPLKTRGKLVEQFNGKDYVPFMVLSLKAGGTGLNLTAANHVVHFDRWWNPAIENQATDRAFRIGQQKSVNVYKFVCVGTIEEKIDAHIQSKQKLAQDVISASKGENWITEMNNADLMGLFTLG